jgi:hypothetical protein
MTKRGTATQTVGSMNESEFQSLPGTGKITSATIDSTISGDMSGTSTSILLMLYDDEGHARYNGYQTLTGSIGGKSGSTVFWVEGGYDGERIVTHFRFLPEYGTDDLRGLKGGGSATAGHGNIVEYEFEYSFLTD